MLPDINEFEKIEETKEMPFLREQKIFKEFKD